MKQPEIEEKEHSVAVYITHSPLASPEETVLEYLKTHEEITNRIGRDLTGIRSENSMKDVFLRLKKRQLIEQVPERRGNLASWRNCTGANVEQENGSIIELLAQVPIEQSDSKPTRLPTIEPDKTWPDMWRVRLPDGSLSDMTNLTRAKDYVISLGRAPRN